MAVSRLQQAAGQRRTDDAVLHLEMDCINLQVRTLSASTHSGRGATGTILDTIKAGEWEPIPPNTFALSAWMRACGK
jgi:hypothetical protein